MLDFKLTEPTESQSQESAQPVEEIYDVIILGAGPGGLTAATYTSRARLRTLVLAGPLPGGQPANTDTVENFLGFPEGIRGPELAQRFQDQPRRFGAEVLMETATRVDLSAPPFTVTTHQASYSGRTLIIATGAVPRRLGVPGEDRFFGRGVSICATCDGFFYADKRVVVVGGGDSAVTEALFLTRFAREVTIIHRRDELRATRINQERALANPKIRIVWDTVLEEILGDQTVTAVRVRNVKTDQRSTIETDGVFLYVGMEPRTEMFAGQVELDEQGYVVSDRRQHTNVPGVFVAGDVQDPVYRQLVVAAGTGAIAAMEAERFLEQHEEH